MQPKHSSHVQMGASVMRSLQNHPDIPLHSSQPPLGPFCHPAAGHTRGRHPACQSGAAATGSGCHEQQGKLRCVAMQGKVGWQGQGPGRGGHVTEKQAQLGSWCTAMGAAHDCISAVKAFWACTWYASGLQRKRVGRSERKTPETGAGRLVELPTQYLGARALACSSA